MWLYRAFAVANVCAAAASGAFALVAIAAPSVLVGRPTHGDSGTDFFAAMYAVRAVVISAATVGASVAIRRAPRGASAVLAASGVTQLADLAIALRYGTPGVLGSAVGAIIPLGSVAILASAHRQTGRRRPDA